MMNQNCWEQYCEDSKYYPPIEDTCSGDSFFTASNNPILYSEQSYNGYYVETDSPYFYNLQDTPIEYSVKIYDMKPEIPSYKSFALESLVETTKCNKIRRNKKKFEMLNETEKQEFRRHQNRLAAKRCRQKKFDRIAQLEEQIKAVDYQICQLDERLKSEEFTSEHLLGDLYLVYSNKK
ncbi:transcription factor jun-1-like [Octopus sinensis]|uniref:Transcription factor jun-1-like n=1 Tax=Octopus sinensis TaxID=2607531 RepID=A0A6P7TY58_9MOLL|nr:transcription factor jun-1-like [Octopus sinensis]